MDKKSAQKIKKCIFILFILIIGLYRSWIDVFKTLSSGDWPYLFAENIKEFSVFQTPFLWVDPYYRLTAKLGVEYLSLSWEVTEKIFWFYPFIIICVISSWIFISFCLRSFFKIERWLLPTLIGSLIYTTNTYILMIVGGGQMGVGMAYAMASLVLHRLITFVDNFYLSSQKLKTQNSKLKTTSQNLKVQKKLIITGIILAIQLMFDPRMFLLTLSAGIFFIFFQIVSVKQSMKILTRLCLLVGVAAILNIFWIIPNFNFYQMHYENAVNAVEVKFLSFAQFSNVFSLLHPNWPENLFGKTYFLKPEFLLLPILAYSSLLFINKSKVPPSLKLRRASKIQNLTNNLTIEQSNNRAILFFVFLGLLGSFLAKGVNPPFGEINRFLYENIPGMSIFRDPTKFYLLIILSYSVLIPFTVYSIHGWLGLKLPAKGWFASGGKVQNFIPFAFLLLVTCYLFLLIFPAWSGRLGGTFKPRNVPDEYVALKEFIKKDANYSPVLWIPIRQRFGFASLKHPSIDAQDLLGRLESKEFISVWNKKDTKKFLKEEGIRYIIIPYDSEKEIFLSGYVYTPLVRNRAEKQLDEVQWLKKIQSGKIAVYENSYLD